MNYLLKIVFIPLLLSTTGCGLNELSEGLYPPKEIEFAKNYLKKIKEKEFDYVKSFVDPSISKDVTDEKLEFMSSLFHEGEPISVEIIGSQIQVTNSVWQGNFTFEYKFKEGWMVANTALKKLPNGYSVIGFSAYKTPASQKEINAFDLSNKSLKHYAVLISTIISFLFMLFTFFVCIRTKMVRRKWLWALLTWVGFGALQFNWTTGIYEVKLLTIQLIGFGFTASSNAAPWILSATFPAGSLIFWFKRKKLIAEFDINSKFSEKES